MRIHPQILIGSFVTTLLTGCVGYNHTFFMTKSNAGLDFDAKPPTAEINISRKEVVIAPTFEGGQTPPVVASFKPHTGFGSGFQNFFVGVDQTFAGGDAAKTMAMAYDSTNLAPQLTKAPGLTNSDSTIRLSQKPKYTSVFKRLPGPGEISPFIFATDTSLGLKVAWSGAGGAFPDSVKLGFNRKEFAWAPLTMTQDTNDTSTPYHVQMPAFLATIQSKTAANFQTNRTSGIEALQYFATGDAAAWLARQYPVRQAMIDRIDPVASRIGVTQANLDTTAAKGASLGKQASEEIDRLTDPQLDQAAASLQNSGLYTPAQITSLKSETPSDKRKDLKNAPLGYTSPNQVRQLENYLTALKLIK